MSRYLLYVPQLHHLDIRFCDQISSGAVQCLLKARNQLSTMHTSVSTSTTSPSNSNSNKRGTHSTSASTTYTPISTQQFTNMIAQKYIDAGIVSHSSGQCE
mmetsp:Transcript_5971/g.9843  ORF Transcript_5971/g.9843 Transcript_5971/m.9843 type:complete len:101 (-) Transcript_5971:45-347(-)